MSSLREEIEALKERLRAVEVAEARENRVCRICRKSHNTPLTLGDSFVLDFGREFAHRSCLAALPSLSAEPDPRVEKLRAWLQVGAGVGFVSPFGPAHGAGYTSACVNALKQMSELYPLPAEGAPDIQRCDMDVGPYKGHKGWAQYDSETGEFHGTLQTTRDVVTFVGRTPVEVAIAFRDSVDDYLDMLHPQEADNGEPTPPRPPMLLAKYHSWRWVLRTGTYWRGEACSLSSACFTEVHRQRSDPAALAMYQLDMNITEAGK